MFSDDIVALATPPGEGGISLIRMSGAGVIRKICLLFRPFRADISLQDKPGFSLTLGWIVNHQGEKIDEVLIGLMRSPRSYTGEDMVEINCHGGTVPARKIIEIVMSLGIRAAEPGEFTRRAFLNGRLDLSQAEAIADLVKSKTEKGLKIAVKQLEGSAGALIKNIEDSLIGLNAAIEASLDFPDEVGELDYLQASETIQEQIKKINKILIAGQRGAVYREGVNVAISGKPNVGKSSLLNALLGKEKSIVTSIPGTTRDIVEDYVNIRGIPVKIMDTAGIRKTEDEVEKIGVNKAQQAVQEADIVIFLLDVSSGINAEDISIYEKLRHKKLIILVNKEDLIEKKIGLDELKQHFGGVRIIHGSVKEEVGLDEIEAAIEELILAGDTKTDDMEIMINIRQKEALLRAARHLEESLQILTSQPLDCLSVDIGLALAALGEVTGKNIKEEVIDRIFRDFCIGK